jgi:hypothetical protein
MIRNSQESSRRSAPSASLGRAETIKFLNEIHTTFHGCFPVTGIAHATLVGFLPTSIDSDSILFSIQEIHSSEVIGASALIFFEIRGFGGAFDLRLQLCLDPSVGLVRLQSFSSGISEEEEHRLRYFPRSPAASASNRSPGPIPPACIGCTDYYGVSHGGNRLICGIHPFGAESDTCADYNGGTIVAA